MRKPSRTASVGRVVVLLLVLALVACASGRAETPGSSPAKLRVLHTVRETHDLSAAEATLGYPVDLKAVVTFCDRKGSTLFVQDKTGGVFVSINPQGTEPLPTGALVEVQGTTAPGQFAAIVMKSQVRVIGRSHLPTRAPRMNLIHLMTGAQDSQWVEVEGIIHSADLTDRDVRLKLALTDGMISAMTMREPGVDYTSLTNARVVLRAVAATVFNGNRQIIGARLSFPDLSTLRVIEPSPAAPFAEAVEPIAILSRFSRQVSSPRRVHLRGVVTLVWPGSMVCIQDATGGLCAQTTKNSDVQLGMVADVAGFPAHGESAPILTDGFARGVPGKPPMQEHPLTVASVLSVDNDAKVVEVEGELVSRDLSSSDTVLMLSSGGAIFSAVLPKGLTTAPAAAWKNGSNLRVRGICSVQVDTLQSARTDGMAVPKAYRLMLRSTSDIVVLRQPTWWTPGHSFVTVGAILVVTVLVLGWAAALRRTVEQQTRTIRESEERFRHMAQHDALTGLATRSLLHDRLTAALARCRRDGTGLGLLMVDLDHFKGINDAHGHAAGDLTLCMAAQRMTDAVRGCDTVARMGGDEFIVLLTDVPDLRVVEEVARKLVAALTYTFVANESEVRVTASVGVCAALNDQFDADGLLKRVDAAMYRAKAQGRGRFQLAGATMLEATV